MLLEQGWFSTFKGHNNTQQSILHRPACGEKPSLDAGFFILRRGDSPLLKWIGKS